MEKMKRWKQEHKARSQSTSVTAIENCRGVLFGGGAEWKDIEHTQSTKQIPNKKF